MILWRVTLCRVIPHSTFLFWSQIVCRSCSRNRCPLKYLKGRMAKVCDHCYSQLQARGTSSPRPPPDNPRREPQLSALSPALSVVRPCLLPLCSGPPGSASSAPTRPRLGRTRPLSAVFQNIHPPNLWRHRKGTASFTPVCPSLKTPVPIISKHLCPHHL